MPRTGSLRPIVIALAPLVSSLVVGATPAYATHHRYATIYWERVLNHPNPAEIQVKVTIEIGARLSFPWGTPATPTVNTVVTYG